jgi:DNA-binding transcriptional MerR regulator/ubiquinone/menaquinone biosynthesis C-methylase UbiE
MNQEQKKGAYTTGTFAKMANVSLRTIRYYDKTGLLKPSGMTEAGYRLYTDADFVRLQRILTLKYLGFSLEEIKELGVRDSDADYVKQSLKLQQELVEKKIAGLQLVQEALGQTREVLDRGEEIDWEKMLELIHMVNMERTLAEQYKNGNNLDVRIRLHRDYATNPKGWFPWIFEQMQPTGGKEILEVGCGNGALWQWARTHQEVHLEKSHVILSDSSAGMVAEAEKRVGTDGRFAYACFDCADIPLEDECVDMVVANHVMFYVKKPEKALAEMIRVLKPGGIFICSTYGRAHMKEISALVQEFDPHIVLSQVRLYEAFGLETGQEQLEPFFKNIQLRRYEDRLKVTAVEPLLDYIMSCHGNQYEYLNAHYGKFKAFLKEKLSKKGYLEITKDAGMFYCVKEQ